MALQAAKVFKGQKGAAVQLARQEFVDSQLARGLMILEKAPDFKHRMVVTAAGTLVGAACLPALCACSALGHTSWVGADAGGLSQCELTRHAPLARSQPSQASLVLLRPLPTGPEPAGLGVAQVPVPTASPSLWAPWQSRPPTLSWAAPSGRLSSRRARIHWSRSSRWPTALTTCCRGW